MYAYKQTNKQKSSNTTSRTVGNGVFPILTLLRVTIKIQLFGFEATVAWALESWWEGRLFYKSGLL